MDINSLISLLKAGLPVWILTGGGLLCLTVDALAGRHGKKILYPLASLVFVLALWFAFRQWLGGTETKQDLLVADRMTLFFVFVVIFVGLLSLFNTYSYLKAGGEDKNKGMLETGVVTLILFSVVGMIFLFASDHLIVNFVGLEIMSLAIYILTGSNKNDVRSNEAAMKYYVMGSAASALLLYGIALLYGSFGTFELSELAQKTVDPAQAFFPKMAVALIFSGMLFKLALVPFHFWVPDVYEGAPSPITGFMATGVKAAAFALFIRILTAFTFFPAGMVHQILVACVILTVLVGNLAALMQDNVKRMLAYSSIAHAGYLLLGLAAAYKEGKFDPAVSSAVLFYLLGYTFMTLGAFAVLSVMVHEKKEVCQYSDLRGLGFNRPWLAAALSLFMLSLLGLPATVGFMAKYAIFSQAVTNGYVGLVILAVITVVISAYYYLRPLVMMYFREPAIRPAGTPESYPIGPVSFPLMFSVVLCAVAVIYLGLFPTPYLKMAELAVGMIR